MKDKMREKFLTFLDDIGVTEEEYINLSEEDLQANIPYALAYWLRDEYLDDDTRTWGDYTLAKFKESPFYHPCFGSMVNLGDIQDGRDYEIQVVKFVDLDRYYKRTGYTGSSQGNTEWDLSWYLTVPRKRLITEYP